MMNDSVRRIMAEVKEFNALNNSSTSFFRAYPLESDLFEWHFTVRGPPDTDFARGYYHGRILLPAEYPLKAPEIVLLTPNGRFEVNQPICLSVTAHHQETWRPSWGIRTILTALVGFMPSKAEGLGALDYPSDTRRRLAIKSREFCCGRCGRKNSEQFGDAQAGDANEERKAEKEEERVVETKIDGDTALRNSDGEHDAQQNVPPPGDGAQVPQQTGTHSQTPAPATASAPAHAPAPASEVKVEPVPAPAPAPAPEIEPTPQQTETQTETQTQAQTVSPVQRQPPSRQQPHEERALLYLAYAIAALALSLLLARLL